MAEFDLVVANGWLVDPAHGRNGRFDIGIAGGRVLAVEPSLAERSAAAVVDAGGRLVTPGLVDSHVHIPGRGIAHREMARAGVTCAVDYGRFRAMLDELPASGAGLCVAGLETVGPWPTDPPTLTEVERLTDEVMADGALGTKIMGGHSPSSPAATAMIIEAANRRHAYVAYHCGTTATGSQLHGLREAFELAGRNRLHLAHINAYLRGMVRPALEENMEAFERLAEAYWMVSESHLGPRNGTGGGIGPDGVPVDWVTRNCLRMGSYPLTREGLRAAIAGGYAAVMDYSAGRVNQVTGAEGVALWEAAGTRTALSFPVNLRSTALLCATAKVRRESAPREPEFVIDAISTDGGAWRNLLAQNGLALVAFGGLTLDEFVAKVSLVPARLYGMLAKGHLGVGADGDVSVLDSEGLKAYATIVGGKVVMLDGAVLGTGATIVTTACGERRLRERGFATQVVEIERSLFWTKGDRDPGPGRIEVL